MFGTSIGLELNNKPEHSQTKNFYFLSTFIVWVFYANKQPGVAEAWTNPRILSITKRSISQGNLFDNLYVGKSFRKLRPSGKI